MFHVAEPLTPDQHAAVVASKQLIYDGFRAALDGRVAKDRAGILVDEEFGADILRDARRKGYITALSTETSGSDEFEFEYGDDFGAHIESFDPTFAKVLIRYNPEGDAALNRRQAARLKRLSEYCRTTDRKLMLELLVPATDAELAAAGGNRATYDADARPALMERVIRELQDAGVEPDVWKIEGASRWPHRGGLHRARPQRGSGTGRHVARGGRLRAGLHRLRRGAHHLLGPGRGVRRRHADPRGRRCRDRLALCRVGDDLRAARVVESHDLTLGDRC
jgi:hypothetical protein